MIAEEWEGYDELLRKRKSLRPQWHIVRRDETTLLTSLGSVTYHKTRFKNKHTERMNTFSTGSWDWRNMPDRQKMQRQRF